MKKRNFGYETDIRRNLLICTNCVRKSFGIPATSAPVERVSAQVDYPCSHTVYALATMLLSELVMTKSNINSAYVTVDACFIDSDDSDIY